MVNRDVRVCARKQLRLRMNLFDVSEGKIQQRPFYGKDG